MRCRQMLEFKELSDGGDAYIRRRLVERGVKPEAIAEVSALPRKSVWRILKDLIKGAPSDVT